MTAQTGRRLHAVWMLVWAAQMAVVAVVMWPWDWRAYLVEISLYANFASNWSGYSAERPSEVEVAS